MRKSHAPIFKDTIVKGHTQIRTQFSGFPKQWAFYSTLPLNIWASQCLSSMINTTQKDTDSEMSRILFLLFHCSFICIFLFYLSKTTVTTNIYSWQLTPKDQFFCQSLGIIDPASGWGGNKGKKGKKWIWTLRTLAGQFVEPL